ncbi:MAG: type II toxin-antitoxin system VapC family toxin [Leptospirales bacterium]
MNSYVVDCSFSSALFLPDENSESIKNFFLKLNKKDNVYTPVLWYYETANVLNISVKRNRLTHSDAFSVGELFKEIGFTTDIYFGVHFTKELFDLTQLYGISSYDAVYLELAMRKKAELKTLDKGLMQAAKKIGVPV